MEILVPICICCLLPLGIVAIVSAASANADNKRAEVLMKAIESNNNLDVDKLAEALGKSRKTPRQILNGRLLRGCIFTLLGVVLMISSAVIERTVDLGNSSPDSFVFPLLAGGCCLAVGISFLIVYFVTRKQVDDKA